MARPRHGKKEYEEFLRIVERRPGYQIKGGGAVHFQIFCSCGEHMYPLSTTPRVLYPLRQLLKQLARVFKCWPQEDRR